MKSWIAGFLAAMYFGVLSCPAAVAQQAPPSVTATLNASAATDALCTGQACLTLTPLFNSAASGAAVCYADVSNGPAGAFTGTGQFEVTSDPSLTNWYQVPATSFSAGAATQVTNFTTAGLYVFPIGTVGVRVRMTAFTVKGADITLSCGGQGPLPGAGTATIAANSSVNITQVSGGVLATGVPVQYFGKPNTVGQPCWGMSTTTGTVIPSATISGSLTASTPVQVVALVAAKNVHVCNFHYSGVTTTGADIVVEYGTGAICATGTTTIDNIYIGVNADVWKETGNGTQDVYALPSAQALCIAPGAFVGTLYYFFDYAQY